MEGGLIVNPPGASIANGDGSQYLQIQTSSSSGGPPAPFVTLTSAASLLTIADNTTYTLTVAVASISTLPNREEQGTISFLAGGTSTASKSISVRTPTFVDYTTSFTTAPSGDSRVGLPLTVELRETGDFHLDNITYESEFDNVRVDASPAPEPCAAATVGVALAGLGLRRRWAAGR